MSIYGMNMDLFSSSPIVILKVEDENRYLPIWIGQAEARSILFKLQNQEFVRPLTHDLALRSGAEIFASDKVIEEAGVVFEEAMEDTPEDEVVDKFKDWMNQVSPEDFK